MAKLTSGIRMSQYTLDEVDGNLNPASNSPYYLAFILNPTAGTSATSTKQAGVIAFNGSANGQFLRGVFTILKQTEAAFRIGLSGTYGGTPKNIGVWYQFGVPNLFIIKFDAVNNTMWIWANPAANVLSSTTENIGASKMRFDFETETSLSSIRSISIFQRDDLEATIGGIRLARSWADIVKDISTDLSDAAQSKIVVKEQYYNVSGVEILIPQDKQIYIKKTTYDDGSNSAEKMLYLESWK